MSDFLNKSWSDLFGTSQSPTQQAANGVPADRIPAEVVARAGQAPPGTAPLAAAKAAPADKIEEQVYRERVLVHVYDLGQTFITKNVLNKVAKSYGAFHTGVEVYGKEWSFGMTFDPLSTGITWNPPGQNPDHTFRETLFMGYTSYSPSQVLRLIQGMKKEWKGSSYQLLTRNCHNFSDVFCQRLGVAKIPQWVNTLAQTGAHTADFLDSADSGYDGGEALFDFFRGMKKHMYSALTLHHDDEEEMQNTKQQQQQMYDHGYPYQNNVHQEDMYGHARGGYGAGYRAYEQPHEPQPIPRDEAPDVNRPPRSHDPFSVLRR
eukprot:TRINITY_DN13543_c0_g1_i1.p1 TRINITY_DN13543_c0_g1~~TRINITY_DN13543_c0_g1_i1.p1  ORF type:complete len:343 (-),score=66.11 TRINITY_DN13543_c0_g1_i1:117-1073(-)